MKSKRIIIEMTQDEFIKQQEQKPETTEPFPNLVLSRMYGSLENYDVEIKVI